MGGRTKRGLKRKYSLLRQQHLRRRFSQIIKDQGGLCWYCNESLGGDANREHLLSRALGGTDTHPPDNVKATHTDCNTAVAHLSVADKYRLREVGHNEGRRAMILMARQLVRADARIAFQEGRRVMSRGNRGYWRTRAMGK